jgi:hypothetical protein
LWIDVTERGVTTTPPDGRDLAHGDHPAAAAAMLGRSASDLRRLRLKVAAFKQTLRVG